MLCWTRHQDMIDLLRVRALPSFSFLFSLFFFPLFFFFRSGIIEPLIETTMTKEEEEEEKTASFSVLITQFY